MSVCWRTRLQEHQQKSYNVWKHGKQLGEVCSGLRGDCLKFLEQLVHVEYCGFDLLTVLQASAISECGGQQFDASQEPRPTRFAPKEQTSVMTSVCLRLFLD